MKIKSREICLYSILGALTFISKFMLSSLPNIEIISLLLIVYTITFGKHTIYPLTAYILMEFTLYGFGIWSIGYLYIWSVLVLVTLILYNITHTTNVFLWAIISGIFGFLFGALYIPLYIVIGDITTAIAWWVSGIPYDIIHGISNFILCLILFKPLMKLFLTIQN